MKKIILDTNFLLIPAQFKVDIFSEIDRICLFNYKMYIVDKSIDELKSIVENQKGRNKSAAKMALQLVKNKNIEMLKTGKGKVDDLILSILNKDTILATQDILLRRRAAEKGAELILLRSKKYLILK